MAEAWNEKDVFLGALALPPAEREAYLRRACPDEAARARIQALLQHHVQSADLFSDSAEGTSRPPAPPMPEQIDEFKIIAPIDEKGGQGLVYLAHDTSLDRRVALKILAPQWVGSEQALARFRAEARSAAALNHPSIVPVHKFGFDGTRHYLASEYVNGPTLAAVIEEERERRKAVAPGTAGTDWRRRCAEIVSVVADALEAAHRARIVHRDVKPSNILMDPQRGPRLTDFGIAKHLTEEARTVSSAGWGSCHYMSPEQASIAGAKVDERSDIFSLGVVLYEMLSLQKPFDGGTVAQVLRAVASVEPAKLRTLDRRIPRNLETICHTALEKDPSRRYQKATQMGADLRCFLEGLPISRRPPGPGERGLRWVKAHRHSMVASGGALAVGAAGVMGWAYRRAGQESMAWLSVEADVPGCVVYVQGFSPDTLGLTGEPERLGEAPVMNILRATGQYRVTVSTEDGFVEFTVPLLEKGRRGRTVLRVHPPGPDGVSGAYRESQGTLRVLHGTLVANSADRGAMVTVESGTYVIGRFDDENPAVKRRAVELPAFEIDAAEVSNSEYRAFTAATGHPWPRHWKEFGYDRSLADLPVIGVTLEDAEAYARWRGKRLPTMFEWEAATGSPYPWGSEVGGAPAGLEPALDDLLVARSRVESELYDQYRLRAVAVTGTDAAPCAGGRMLHAYGNVYELTETVFPADRAVVIAGGSWLDSPRYHTLADVSTFPMDKHSFKLGFRCARSARPAEPAH